MMTGQAFYCCSWDLQLLLLACDGACYGSRAGPSSEAAVPQDCQGLLHRHVSRSRLHAMRYNFTLSSGLSVPDSLARINL